MSRLIGCLLLFCSLTVALSSVTATPVNFTNGIRLASQRYAAVYSSFKIGEFPEKTIKENGSWTKVNAANWVSGFYPGCLWYLYELTGDPQWKAKARTAQTPLAKISSTADHDIGFRVMCSYGNGYRLTKDPSYLQTIEAAAGTLAARFNSHIGAIKSWNWPTFPVIIDNMMNIDLLYAANTTSNAKKFYDVATIHATTTLREHFRHPVWSTYHLVDYDLNTGIPRTKGSVQGYAFNSTWARGQAWAVYGFAQVYSYTKDKKFLDASLNAADFYLAHGLPEDFVPYWDFNDPRIPNIWRDSSAASCLAVGLLMLAETQDNPLQSKYFQTAEKILESLNSNYLTTGSNLASVLAHATQNAPGGYRSYDTGIVFGDYYFLEAIVTYNRFFKK